MTPARSQSNIREAVERLGALHDCEKVIAALKIATNTLVWYASEKNWHDDDWGCRAVIAHPDYSNGGQKARRAIGRIEKALQ